MTFPWLLQNYSVPWPFHDYSKTTPWSFHVMPWRFNDHSITIPWQFHDYTMHIQNLFHDHSMTIYAMTSYYMTWSVTSYSMLVTIYSIIIEWLFHIYSMTMPWLFHENSITIPSLPWLFHDYSLTIPWLFRGTKNGATTMSTHLLATHCNCCWQCALLCPQHILGTVIVSYDTAILLYASASNCYPQHGAASECPPPTLGTIAQAYCWGAKWGMKLWNCSKPSPSVHARLSESSLCSFRRILRRNRVCRLI
jgi:hypothetical protein